MLPSAALASPSPAAAPSRPRLDGLTGLRFFAAAWVFAYHFLVLTVSGAPWWLSRAQNAGHAAVSLFFVLSGFVLAYNYGVALADGRVTRARFLWLRLARVWPLYALVALVEVPLALHAGTAPARIGAATAADLVGLQAWIPAITFVGNTPGWSVSVELFFYALFPWLALATARRARVVIPIALGVALAAAATPALVSPASAAATFLKCGPLLRLPEFVVGIALGRAFVARRTPLAPAAANVLAAVATLAVVAIVLGSGAVPRYFLHALLLPAFALLLWAVASGGARPLGWAPLALLGEASYGLYLMQMPLFSALGGKFEWPAARMLAFFGLLCALSIAVHFAVEKPAQRWLRARAPR
ncbi:MAG TPA: acyltransferase [Polyangia bacterium]|jgi:peptidoglycan/LPS O-acetylase OafA/YrhL